jgi:hypothetical protein
MREEDYANSSHILQRTSCVVGLQLYGVEEAQKFAGAFPRQDSSIPAVLRLLILHRGLHEVSEEWMRLCQKFEAMQLLPFCRLVTRTG